MKVTNSSANQAQATETSSAKRTDKAKAAAKGTSNVTSAAPSESGEDAKTSISSRAKDAASIKAAADGAPDVREAKIAALRQRIAEGKYNVSPEEVADRMVDEHLSSGIG